MKKLDTKKWTGILIVSMLVATLGTTVVAAQIIEDTGYPGLGVRLQVLRKLRELKHAREELKQMVEDFGVDLPDLSRGEKRQIAITVQYFRMQGASREEIRDEIKNLLIEFGVDLPDIPEMEKEQIKAEIISLLEGYGFVFVELTEEQKDEIKNTAREMFRDGASREEIRDEVKNVLERYGFDIPELTEEQKNETREGIRTILLDHDIELPDLTEGQQEQIRNKREEIREIRWELLDLLRQL